MLPLFLALAAITVYRTGESEHRDRIVESARSAAETAATLSGLAGHAAIRSPDDTDSDVFRDVVTDLSALRASNASITRVRTLAPMAPGGSWGVVVDLGGGASDDSIRERTRERLAAGAAPPEGIPPDLLRVGAAVPVARIAGAVDGGPVPVVAAAPIRSRAGAVNGLVIVELRAEHRSRKRR